MKTKIQDQSDYYINCAEADIETVKFARDTMFDCIDTNTPMKVSVTGSGDYLEVLLDGRCVLTVVNLNTTPIVPQLDTISLSQTGRLNAALDFRPFMLSGPCPTSILWAGSNESELSEKDAGDAFKYWLQFMFGVLVDDETGLFKR